MKLKIQSCPQCEAPLHLEGERLVCEYCGFNKEIEKDSNDIAYEQIANAEEFIRRSLQNKKAELQEYYAEQERKQLEKEAEEARRQRKRKIERMVRRLKSLLKTCIIIVVMFLVARFLGPVLINKIKESKAQSATVNTTTTTTKEKVRKNNQVGKSDILSDPTIMEKAEKMALDYVTDQHDRGILISSKEIWNISGTPKLLEKYYISSENKNGLYFIYETTIATDGGDTKTAYDCIVLYGITVSSDGTVNLPDRAHDEKAEDYDFFWHAGFSLENLKKDVLGEKRENKMTRYFIFEL